MKVEITASKRYSTYLKHHLSQEHPATRGKIKLKK